MPRRKDREKNRLKSARLKTLSRLPISKTLRKPSDPKQAEEWLLSVADHLSNYPNAGLAHRFVAYAIKKAVRAGKPEALAKELGLIYPPGKPRTFKERIADVDTAREIDALIHAENNWEVIEERLDRDKRTLQRIYDRHAARFRKEERTAPIDQEIRKFIREDLKPS